MEKSIPRKIFDRLLYIMCSQNWENMATHFWIKQALEVKDKIMQELKCSLLPEVLCMSGVYGQMVKKCIAEWSILPLCVNVSDVIIQEYFICVYLCFMIYLCGHLQHNDARIFFIKT